MPTTKTLPNKPSHHLLADLFAAAPVIREIALSEHQEACANRKPGAYYSTDEAFTNSMRDFADKLIDLSETFDRILKNHGKEVKR